MPGPNRVVATHFREMVKHLDLFHFSQNESLTSFSHLVHTTLERKHNLLGNEGFWWKSL